MFVENRQFPFRGCFEKKFVLILSRSFTAWDRDKTSVARKISVHEQDKDFLFFFILGPEGGG